MTQPYVIVFGNEKGGTGKSTVAMHVSVFLLNAGFDVCTIDVDARQGTFTQYFRNRALTAEKRPEIKLSRHISVPKSTLPNKDEAEEFERKALNLAIEDNMKSDFILIDTPGNDTFLSRLSHAYANTLITPMNESFVDLDVLVKVSQDDILQFHPSIYAEMVWNQRKERAKHGKRPLDWIVVKNRLTTLYNKNRKDVHIVLEALAKRIGFRLCSGFCERVIFKELFVSGLTLLDLENTNQMSLSHVAARQELRDLIKFMNIPLLQDHKVLEA